jgi:hypothetical protein
MSAGLPVTCGAVVSTTLTAKAAGAEVLPDASLAVQETVVVPSAKVAPEALSQDTVGDGSIASTADTENVTATPFGPVASLVIGAGTDTVGGPRSTTVMVKLAAAEVLCDASVAVHETVVVPSGNVSPVA